MMGDICTLVLIRHGESEANRNNAFAGQINPDLVDNGLMQAELTAEYVATNYKIDAIYSSDLTRAYKTALALGRRLDMDVVRSEELREIRAGEWEGLAFDDIKRSYPREFDTWMKDIGSAICNGGESVAHLAERVMRFVTDIADANRGKTIAMATHATPIRAVQCLIEHGSLSEMKNIPWVTNASVTVLEYVDGKWSVKAVSIDEHLHKLKTALPNNI